MIKSALEKVIMEDMADLWSLLDGDEKRLVLDNFQLHEFKKNQIIYAEGETPEYLWCLISGKVKKFKDGAGGRVQILRLIRPVQYFGYRAYFAREAYVSSSATLEQSVVGSLPMTLVENMIKSNNRLAMFFIHELSRNLGASDSNVVSLTQKHIRGRLADALIVLRDHYGLEEDGLTLRIYMGREDLANMSNMTTSNAIRVLSAFVSEKIVVVDGRKIKILNEQSLRRISKFG